MLNFWTYVRSRARDAFLAGVADALLELDGQAPEDLGAPLAQLKARLQPQLPFAGSASAEVVEVGNGKGRTRHKAE